MKKIYVLTVVCLALAFTGAAQTYYWIGSSGGAWSIASNWSLSSHGAASAAAPHLTSDNVIFDTSINVQLDLSVSINSIVVISGKSVKITGTASDVQVITLNSTNAAAPGLRIDAGAALECDADPNSGCVIDFPEGGQGSVSGEWLFSGNTADDVNAFAYFTLSGSVSSTRLNINNGGKITIGPTGFIYPNEMVGRTELVFKAGSTLEFKSDGPAIPEADYDAASTILLTGIVNVGLTIDDVASLGNLTYNCPLQAVDADLRLYNINVNGNLSILNTNNQNVSLIGNRTIDATNVNVGIGGDLVVSGPSKVIVSRLDDVDKTVTLNIQGNLVAGGTSFDLQATDNVVHPTNLLIKGNLQHTAGTFGVSSLATNENTSVFNIEFDGTAPQTITSYSGLIDGLSSNHQLTLRMNNASGVTLGSNIEVGRVDFTGPNQGVINTGASYLLTVSNTSGNNVVVNGPSNNGYVNGRVARRTASTLPTVFPSGIGGVLRKLTVTPSNTSSNTFEVNLLAPDNGGAKVSPVATLASYYWNVTRTGSASATVTMDLVGSIGASATDTLIPAKYDGTSWLDARGSTGNYLFPGNSTSGTLTSGTQSTFQAFTIASVINATLAIKLVSFTGRKMQNTAELAWEVTENSTPAKFEVVKSIDGTSFTSVGFLVGVEGKLNYSLTDNSIAAGNNFYRLKMYDRDGTITFSNIIVVMNGSKGILISSMIPTVVQDRARLNVSSSIKGNMQLVVTDISGRMVLNQLSSINPGNQEVWLNTSSLSAGMFQVTGYINGERTTTFRFVKQ